ncbi:MAG TPA: B12-binding domain-containing radical SAM protein, partial [Chloroflexota bacterium]|nr:B12-binding domain-containing radical SAM protein [Chloroflexota bacterium]
MAQNQPINVDALLARVNSPAHYAGGEWNSCNKDWDAVAVRLCLAFPDTYEIGMSNLGIQILCEIVNEMPDALCDRAFTPWPDMAKVLRETGNHLFGLESRRPLRDFDAVGFSIPYELGASNILEMLDLGGIPVLAAERGADDPIVIGGGASLVNPEPLADFYDLIVIGEGEEILPALLAELRDLRSASPDWRPAFLKSAAPREGVYVPAFYQPAYRPDYSYAGIASRDPAAPPEIRRLHVDIDHHVR